MASSNGIAVGADTAIARELIQSQQEAIPLGVAIGSVDGGGRRV